MKTAGENSFNLSLAPGKGWKQLIVVIGRGYQLRPKQKTWIFVGSVYIGLHNCLGMPLDTVILDTEPAGLVFSMDISIFKFGNL